MCKHSTYSIMECGFIGCFRFPYYTYEEREDLRNFLFKLANATYGTFKDVPPNNHEILPSEYLYYVHLLKGDVSYIVSNSHAEIVASMDMVPTITELGMCLTYNGEIAPYNNYKLVAHDEYPSTCKRYSNDTYKLLFCNTISCFYRVIKKDCKCIDGVSLSITWTMNGQTISFSTFLDLIHTPTQIKSI